MYHRLGAKRDGAFHALIFQSARCNRDAGRIYLGPHILYSYGAHLAYVEIDTLTGCAEVIRYLAATDAGSVINPQTYELQIQGAIAQGIRFALSEEYKVTDVRASAECRRMVAANLLLCPLQYKMQKFEARIPKS